MSRRATALTRFLLAATLLLLGGSVVAQEEAPPDSQRGLRSASYQLFAIEGSGVSGTLNVTERVGGGTTFVVTGIGINPGVFYQPVLFAGDCGPDRERIAELALIGSVPEDPFVSISEVSMPFEQVAEGDYFLYIYPEGGDGEPLACGEVGAGANR